MQKCIEEQTPFGAPKGGTPKVGPPKGGGAQNFVLFVSSPATISLFLCLSGCLVEFLVVFKAPGPSNVHVWALGLSCETPACGGGRVGVCLRFSWVLPGPLLRTPLQGHGASNTTKIPRKDPQEREEKLWWESEKKSEILGGPAEGGVRLRGSGQILDAPTKILNTPPTHPTPHTTQDNTTQDNTRNKTTQDNTNRSGFNTCQQVLKSKCWPKVVLAQSGAGLKRYWPEAVLA